MTFDQCKRSAARRAYLANHPHVVWFSTGGWNISRLDAWDTKIPDVCRPVVVQPEAFTALSQWDKLRAILREKL